jgi:Sodium/hydrogen exchanger family
MVMAIDCCRTHNRYLRKIHRHSRYHQIPRVRLLPIYFPSRIFGYKSGIRFKDLVFISYAGMIRGAVAFGLVLRIDESVANRSVIVTTSLSLVVITTVVLGSTVATVQNCLFKKEQEAAAALKRAGAEHLAVHLIDHDQSHHEVDEHPNFDDIKEELKKDEADPPSTPSEGKKKVV